MWIATLCGGVMPSSNLVHSRSPASSKWALTCAGS